MNKKAANFGFGGFFMFKIIWRLEREDSCHGTNFYRAPFLSIFIKVIFHQAFVIDVEMLSTSQLKQGKLKPHFCLNTLWVN